MTAQINKLEYKHIMEWFKKAKKQFFKEKEIKLINLW